jgi:hypothetical protein
LFWGLPARPNRTANPDDIMDEIQAFRKDVRRIRAAFGLDEAA